MRLSLCSRATASVVGHHQDTGSYIHWGVIQGPLAVLGGASPKGLAGNCRSSERLHCITPFHYRQNIGGFTENASPISAVALHCAQRRSIIVFTSWTMEETAEQELARRLQQPAATQNSGSYSACSKLNAVNVLRTDFDTGDQCYVFHVAASTHSGTVAAALSNHAVKLYTTRDSGGFSYLGELKGHTDLVSEIAFAGGDNPHAVYSSSEDGTIRGWDSRTGKQAQRFSPMCFQLANTPAVHTQE